MILRTQNKMFLKYSRKKIFKTFLSYFMEKIFKTFLLPIIFKKYFKNILKMFWTDIKNFR